MKLFRLATVLVVVLMMAGSAFAADSVYKDVKMAGKMVVKGDYDKAIQSLTCAIFSGKLDRSGLAVAFYYRGLAYFKKGCCQAAVADLTSAINMLEQYGAAYYVRAQAYKCLKCDDKAKADMATFEKYKKAFGLSKGPGKYLAGKGKPQGFGPCVKTCAPAPVCNPCCPPKKPAPACKPCCPPAK